MADPKLRLDTNAAGALYVDRTCIDCDACRQLAPATFLDVHGRSSVQVQPRTADELAQALQALVACPVGAIGDAERRPVRDAIAAFPMHIDGPVSYLGFNSEDSFGADSYLLEHPDGNWMIDAPRWSGALVRAIAERGGLRYVFLTHRDDVADAARYAAHFGAQRIIHHADRHAMPDAEIFIEGDAPRAFGDVTVIPAPGHSRGSCVLLYGTYLFSGDHVAWSRFTGKLRAHRTYSHDYAQQLRSIEQLTAYDVSWILPGHGDRIRMDVAEMRAALHELAAEGTPRGSPALKRSAALVALAGAGLVPYAAGAQTTPGLITLRVAAGLTEPTTPILYAQGAGLFAKAGLNVAMQRPQSGAVTAAAILGGALEFGKSSPLELFSAHLRDVPLVWVSPASLYRADAPDGGLLVAKDSPLRTARDLTGKVIAVTALGDLNTIGVRAWTDQNGGDSSTLKLVELSPATMPAALEAGRIDAAALFNPVFEAALSSGKTRLVAHIYDAIAKRFLSAVWFTSRAYADAHREVLERFEHVMVDANAYTNAHFAETLPLIAQYSGLDPAAIAHMTRSVAALYLDVRDVQPLIDSAAKYKVIERSFPAQDLFSPTVLRPPR